MNSSAESEPAKSMGSAVPVRIIVAVARNRVIGKNGRLPWSIPEDWEHFLAATKNGSLICGRHCREELLETGAVDGNRELFVVSTQLRGPRCYKSFPSALAAARSAVRPVWICGGQRIYEEAMSIADELVLTLIDAAYDGDTFFPPWEGRFSELVSERPSRHGEIPLYFRVLRPRREDTAPSCL